MAPGSIVTSSPGCMLMINICESRPTICHEAPAKLDDWACGNSSPHLSRRLRLCAIGTSLGSSMLLDAGCGRRSTVRGRKQMASRTARHRLRLETGAQLQDSKQGEGDTSPDGGVIRNAPHCHHCRSRQLPRSACPHRLVIEHLAKTDKTSDQHAQYGLSCTKHKRSSKPKCEDAGTTIGCSMASTVLHTVPPPATPRPSTSKLFLFQSFVRNFKTLLNSL
jgi:hypothetical protein